MDIYNYALPSTGTEVRLSHKCFIRPKGVESQDSLLPDIEYINNERSSKGINDDDGLQYALNFSYSQYDGGYDMLVESIRVLSQKIVLINMVVPCWRHMEGM